MSVKEQWRKRKWRRCDVTTVTAKSLRGRGANVRVLKVDLYNSTNEMDLERSLRRLSLGMARVGS